MCRGCRFFDTRLRVGRHFRSCSDLGEEPYATACDLFLAARPDDPAVYLRGEFELARAAARARETPKAAGVGTVIADALMRRFGYDQQADEAVQRVLQTLQDNGVVFDTKDINWFITTVDRLLDIQTTRELALGLGSASEVDEIVQRRIETIFGARQMPTPQDIKKAR